jgi:hypothetical protein
MRGSAAAIVILSMLLADVAAGADLEPAPPGLDARSIAEKVEDVFDLEPAPPGLDARTIAEKVEDVFRGNTSYLKATMTVVSPRLPTPRRVEFCAWDDRPGKRSFIRILAPAKDAGMAFLKLHPNLWNFIPRVERTIRIPPSMMLQSWMGSDFTNDDLVRESSQLDDYEHLLLGIDPDPDADESESAYLIEYRPHEDAPVVWGKIVTWVDARLYAPLRQDFYDESGEKLRVIRFSEILPPPLVPGAPRQGGARDADRDRGDPLRRELR